MRLVEVNADVRRRVPVGANHELARELLWRDYPVDLRATFFHRFWEYVDAERTDSATSTRVGARWRRWTRRSARTGSNVEQEAMTVIVVRGDIVRRYPTAHWFLQKAQIDRGGETLAR